MIGNPALLQQATKPAPANPYGQSESGRGGGPPGIVESPKLFDKGEIMDIIGQAIQRGCLSAEEAEPMAGHRSVRHTVWSEIHNLTGKVDDKTLRFIATAMARGAIDRILSVQLTGNWRVRDFAVGEDSVYEYHPLAVDKGNSELSGDWGEKKSYKRVDRIAVVFDLVDTRNEANVRYAKGQPILDGGADIGQFKGLFGDIVDMRADLARATASAEDAKRKADDERLSVREQRLEEMEAKLAAQDEARRGELNETAARLVEMEGRLRALMDNLPLAPKPGGGGKKGSRAKVASPEVPEAAAPVKGGDPF